MPNIADYVAKFEQAVSVAAGYLQQCGYIDPISREPLYGVKTVLPGVAGVSLTLDGKFQLKESSSGISQLTVTVSGVRELSPDQLLQYIVKAAAQQGSIMPSYIRYGKEPPKGKSALDWQIQGLLNYLVHEIEVLPQVVALEQQGRFHKTRELLGC